MSSELLAALVAFAIVSGFTPGPNNVMLMASGLNWGMRRTVPHISGVVVGFSTMVFLVGVGLGAAFEAWPPLYPIIKYLGAAYLLYFAWLIATSKPKEDGGTTRGRPIRFFEAVAFQWVNPKAWVMGVGAIATYAAIASFPLNMAIMGGVFAVVGLASSWSWAMFGTGLKRFLKTPRAVRIFNVVMGLLLVASLIPVVFFE